MVAISAIPTGVRSLFEEHGSLMKYEKNRVLFAEGERAEDLFFLTAGRVLMSKETEGGRELSLRIVGEGDIAGETALFGAAAAHGATGKALEPTTALTLPVSTFEALLSEHAHLLIEWIRWVQTQKKKHETRLRDLVLHGKKGALYSTLIRLSNTYGEPAAAGAVLIDKPFTNQELANFCATSREVINRLLNDMKQEGLISFEKGVITLHDVERLRAAIECDDCPLTICRID